MQLTPDEQQLVEEVLVAAHGDPQSIRNEIEARHTSELGQYGVPELRLALRQCPSPVDLKSFTLDQIREELIARRNNTPTSLELKDVDTDDLRRYLNGEPLSSPAPFNGGSELPSTPFRSAPRPPAAVPPPSDSSTDERGRTNRTARTGELRFPESSGTAPEPPAARTRQQPSTERRPQIAWMAFVYGPLFGLIALIAWMALAHWAHISTIIGDMTGHQHVGGACTFIVGLAALAFGFIGGVRVAVRRKRRSNRSRQWKSELKSKLGNWLSE